MTTATATTRRLASGRVAIVEDRRVVAIVADTDEAELLLHDLDEGEGHEICECEIDWSCPMHAGRLTWIETRYSDSEPEEALF